MKIDKHLDWNDPMIWIEDKDFFIDISGDEVEIEYSSDAGTSHIWLPVDDMIDLLNEYKKARDAKGLKND